MDNLRRGVEMLKNSNRKPSIKNYNGWTKTQFMTIREY